MDFEVINREGGGGAFVFGYGTKIARGVSIDITADVTIGKRCMISEGVMILTHEHDVDDFHSREKIEQCPLVIEDGVFIGTRAIICPKVSRIGENSFIAAGSVVTKDVQSDVIVAGNPAKVIKFK